MIYQSNEELQQACEYWQKKLRLQDWIVKASIRREKELKNREVAGECEWNLHKKMASVRILDPIDYPDDLMRDHDMEWTLVHELLHLHFAPIGRDSDENQEILIEQAIDSIAWGIVNLSRQNKELKEG